MFEINKPRIGNYFYCKSKNEPIEITEESVKNCSEFSPIILDNNWLKAFGYDENSTLYDPLGSKVQYVHELQNLYFMLTNEELILIPVIKDILLDYGFKDGIDEMTLCVNDLCIYWRKFENHFEIDGEKHFINYIGEFKILFYKLTNEKLTLKR